MNNTNEILERILLNMKYDSKKTLSENLLRVKKTNSEDMVINEQVGFPKNTSTANSPKYRSLEDWQNSYPCLQKSKAKPQNNGGIIDYYYIENPNKFNSSIRYFRDGKATIGNWGNYNHSQPTHHTSWGWFNYSCNGSKIVHQNSSKQNKPAEADPNKPWPSKYKCVKYLPEYNSNLGGVKKGYLEDGSTVYALYNYGGDKTPKYYYSDGRYKEAGKMYNYSCDDDFFKTVTKAHNLIKKGDYSLDTSGYGDNKIQLIKAGGHSADYENGYINPGYIGFDEAFLNNGYDYIYIPGKIEVTYGPKGDEKKRIQNITSDGVPAWVMVNKEFRSKWWKTCLDGGLGENKDGIWIQWDQDWSKISCVYRKAGELAINDTGFMKGQWLLGDNKGDGNLMHGSWNPLHRKMMEKINALSVHQHEYNMYSKDLNLMAKRAKQKMDLNKVLKFGDKDVPLERNKNLPEAVFLPTSYGADNMYIRILQEKLNNAALQLQKQSIPKTNEFDLATQKLLKDLTGKTEISLNELDKILKDKGVSTKEPYSGYFRHVMKFKSLGFTNTTCPTCKTYQEHLNHISYKELKTLAKQVCGNKINMGLPCQIISTQAGAGGNKINNYSKSTALELVDNKKFITGRGQQPKITYNISEDDIEKIQNLTPDEAKLGQMALIAKEENKN